MEHIGLQQIFEDENVFEVEAIVGRKKVNGKWLYRVRWKGYSAHHDTWEPRENLLTCEDMIEDYAEKIQRKASKRKAKVSTAKRKVEKKESYKIETNESEPQPSEMKSGHGLKDSFWKDLEEGKINVFESDLYSRVKARPKPVKRFVETGLSQGSAKKKNTDTSKKHSFDQDRVKSKNFELKDSDKLSKQSGRYEEYECNHVSAAQEQDGSNLARKIILSKKICQATKNSTSIEGIYQAKEGSTKISLKQGLSGYYEVSKITNSYEQSLPLTPENKPVSRQVRDQLNANNASCSVYSVTTSMENKVKKLLDKVQDSELVPSVSFPSKSSLQKNVKMCDNGSIESPEPSNMKNKIKGGASNNVHSPSQKSILSHVSVSQPSVGTKSINGVGQNHSTTDITVKDATSAVQKLEDAENKKNVSRALQKASLVQTSPLGGKLDSTDVKEKSQLLIHLDDYSTDEWAKKTSLLIYPPLDISQNELREAVKAGDYNTVKRALNGSRKYDLELPEVNGMTLVMTAAARGYTSITEVLATSGANINAQSKNGLTPLMFACIKDHACTAATLLELGAKKNIRDNWGQTALMLACRYNCYQAGRILLHYGCNFAAVNHENMNALRVAKMTNSLEIQELLTNYISQLKAEFEHQVAVTVNNTADILHALFPLHCFCLSEGPTFSLSFEHNLQHLLSGMGYLLFIAHCRITTSGIKCRLYGPCAVLWVTLNGVKQPSLTEDANYVFSFCPLQNGKNEVVIQTVDAPTANTRLLVCAYQAQLTSSSDP
ncbi:uncharacterized protein LOC143257613 [Tachypleus tridentatus]|uniref:uncharacterized protein LOC143257613 n=1 Tax=Tachypleus tridentatus TaxID=6853 RepID=UPI003FD0674D